MTGFKLWKTKLKFKSTDRACNWIRLIFELFNKLIFWGFFRKISPKRFRLLWVYISTALHLLYHRWCYLFHHFLFILSRRFCWRLRSLTWKHQESCTNKNKIKTKWRLLRTNDFYSVGNSVRLKIKFVWSFGANLSDLEPTSWWHNQNFTIEATVKQISKRKLNSLLIQLKGSLMRSPRCWKSIIFSYVCLHE